jgi:hypothetical protein
MSNKWAKRIQRLELLLESRTRQPTVFRYGPVKYLPDDEIGERHIVASESHATTVPNVERCEFEEQLGPSIDGADLSFNVYLDLGEGSAPALPQALAIPTLPSEASAIEVRQERIL